MVEAKNSKLTTKNIKFINGIISGKTLAQSYIDAYNTRGPLPTVYAEASRAVRKPQVREAIEQALISQNLTPEFAVSELKKLKLQFNKKSRFNGSNNFHVT